MAWNNVFLNNKFILYGYGISNKKVEDFFIENNINYIIVEDDFEINDKYIIIKSPGISNDTFFIKKCLKKKLIIINDIELFYLLRPDIKYIGITGTCGKTTTCTLLYNIMKEKYNVALCGNIGIPIFTFINDDFDYLIIELSSYQLEWINSFRMNYFIVLNVFDHHLNHHHTFENYLNAKFKPIKNLRTDDNLIINSKLIPFLSDQKIKSKIFTFSNDLVKDIGFKIDNINYFKFDCNKENFSSLNLVLKELKVDKTIIYNELLKFNNLPNRMEKIIDLENLIVFNDSKSTSFMSLKEGINHCVNNYKSYKLVIIMGGKIDLEEIRKNIKFIKSLNSYDIYCYGENSLLISKVISCRVYDTLEEVINNLIIYDKQVIIFSPAAQSFDQFKSFEERGLCFKKLIFKKLNL